MMVNLRRLEVVISINQSTAKLKVQLGKLKFTLLSWLNPLKWSQMEAHLLLTKFPKDFGLLFDILAEEKCDRTTGK